MAILAGFGNVLSEGIIMYKKIINVDFVDTNDPFYAENNVLLNDVTISFQDFEHCKNVR